MLWLILLNYSAAVAFVAGSKAVLLQLPNFPWTLSFLESVFAAWCSRAWMCASGNGLAKHISAAQWRLAAASSLLCWLAFASAIVACSVMSASLVETIKATTPLPGVLVAGCLGDGWPGRGVRKALVIIVLGVMMASCADTSASAQGVMSALLMTWGFASSDAIVRFSYTRSDRLDAATMWYLQVQMSIAFSALPAFLEVISCGPVDRTQLGLAMRSYTLLHILLAGIGWSCQNQSTGELLELLPIASFSIITSVRRAVVLVALLLIFRTEMTALNAVGLGVVFLGFVYYLEQQQERTPRAIQVETSDDRSTMSPGSTMSPASVVHSFCSVRSSRSSDDEEWP